MNTQQINKVALITGASKELGFGIARKLGEKGITVLIAARNEEKGQEAVDKLRSEDINAHFIKLDVSDRSSIESAYKA